MKIEELTNDISTLTTERDENVENYTKAQEQINSLTEAIEKLNGQISEANEKIESLSAYKLAIENQEKESVLASYSELLPQSILEVYTEEKLNDYTALDLDKELAYELKKVNSDVFKKSTGYVPKETFKNGIEGILDKYKK